MEFAFVLFIGAISTNHGINHFFCSRANRTNCFWRKWKGEVKNMASIVIFAQRKSCGINNWREYDYLRVRSLCYSTCVITRVQNLSRKILILNSSIWRNNFKGKTISPKNVPNDFTEQSFRHKEPEKIEKRTKFTQKYSHWHLFLRSFHFSVTICATHFAVEFAIESVQNVNCGSQCVAMPLWYRNWPESRQFWITFKNDRFWIGTFD